MCSLHKGAVGSMVVKSRFPGEIDGVKKILSIFRLPWFLYFYRSSMSGLHLVKQGRDRKKIDSQRDFTVASPAEFVTRFGGNKVIEKVSYNLLNYFFQKLMRFNA